MSPGQPGNAVEQDRDILFDFDKPLGFFQDDIGHLGVSDGRLIKSGSHDFPVDAPLEVRDLFRPLRHQKNNKEDLGVVFLD